MHEIIIFELSRGLQLLIPTLCRAELGWIFYLCSANFRKIAGEFLSEFWWRILIANFSALFFQGFRPPKKFTHEIHVQNCRHSSPISLSWTQNLFTAIFCLRGKPTVTDFRGLANSVYVCVCVPVPPPSSAAEEQNTPSTPAWTHPIPASGSTTHAITWRCPECSLAFPQPNPKRT